MFVLAIRRYRQLCRDACFITGVGTKKRLIPLGPIVHALGTAKAAALPGFHAFSGTDVTGRFAGKGKLNYYGTSKCRHYLLRASA